MSGWAPTSRPPPPGTAGLRHWTVLLDSAEQTRAVRDRADAARVEAVDYDRGFAAVSFGGAALLYVLHHLDEPAGSRFGASCGRAGSSP